MEILSQFEIWMFLAGLGIFLFGMHMMEESIRVLSGAAFKSLIRKYTGTRLRAIGSGLFSTAVLQSSSAVSLMVLAFVGAGIMNLVQAISVMMGTKIGTTATAWIVAVFGFEFNIDTFSLPMIGIGGLGIILLAKSPRYVNISKFLVAFGFLFMGLDYMKSSVEQVSDLIDPTILAGYGILVFALAGMVLTAIMQSSSATIAIVLTMLFAGVINFESGAAMVVGANVGTTVTVLLGSIGGMYIKKQAAFSQLIFTVGTAIVTLLLLPFFIWLVLELFRFDGNLVLGLALFHTIFNVAGVIFFYPFVGKLAHFAERSIPEKDIQLSRYIHKTDPNISDAAVEAFRKEISLQLRHTLFFMSGLAGNKKQPAVSYIDLARYHAKIFSYYTQIHETGIGEDLSKRTDELLRASRSIMNAAKNIHESSASILVLKSEVDEPHKSAYRSIKTRLLALTEKGTVLQEMMDDGADTGRSAEVLDELFNEVEKTDKEFIKLCSGAVAKKGGEDLDVTSLLMLNRTVTQSCRMLLFSIRVLLERKVKLPGEDSAHLDQ